MDYFSSDDVSVLVIECLFLVHLVTTFPLFGYVSRN